MTPTTIVDRKAFTEALTTVVRVAEKRTTIPILANVLIDVQRRSLILRSSNLDIECTAKVKCEGTAFVTTVPAHKLLDLCRKAIPSDEITIEAPEDGNVIFHFGRLRCSIQPLSSDDFPTMDLPGEPLQFTMNTVTLLNGLQRCYSAISHEDTRYYLNGIFFEVDGRKLIFTATDGHRLHQQKMFVPAGAEKLLPSIVPVQIVRELMRLCEMKSAEDEIKMAFYKEYRAVFSMGSIVYACKLIDGVYPDYRRVIPKDNNKKLVLDRTAALEAIKAVTVISSKDRRPVKMTLNGLTTFSVANPDVGTTALTIDGKLTEIQETGIGQAAMEIGFNAQYLATTLSEMASDEITLKMADPGSPTIITGRQDGGALYVLMPMRV